MDVSAKILHWKKYLELEQRPPPEKLLKILDRLDDIQVDMQILRATEIGKAVNNLRKDPHVGRRAKDLVSKWKDYVNVSVAGVEDKRRSDAAPPPPAVPPPPPPELPKPPPPPDHSHSSVPMDMEISPGDDEAGGGEGGDLDNFVSVEGMLKGDVANGAVGSKASTSRHEARGRGSLDERLQESKWASLARGSSPPSWTGDDAKDKASRDKSAKDKLAKDKSAKDKDAGDKGNSEETKSGDGFDVDFAAVFQLANTKKEDRFKANERVSNEEDRKAKKKTTDEGLSKEKEELLASLNSSIKRYERRISEGKSVKSKEESKRRAKEKEKRERERKEKERRKEGKEERERRKERTEDWLKDGIPAVPLPRLDQDEPGFGSQLSRPAHQQHQHRPHQTTSASSSSLHPHHHKHRRSHSAASGEKRPTEEHGGRQKSGGEAQAAAAVAQKPGGSSSPPPLKTPRPSSEKSSRDKTRPTIDAASTAAASTERSAVGAAADAPVAADSQKQKRTSIHRHEEKRRKSRADKSVDPSADDAKDRSSSSKGLKSDSTDESTSDWPTPSTPSQPDAPAKPRSSTGKASGNGGLSFDDIMTYDFPTKRRKMAKKLRAVEGVGFDGAKGVDNATDEDSNAGRAAAVAAKAERSSTPVKPFEPPKPIPHSLKIDNDDLDDMLPAIAPEYKPMSKLFNEIDSKPRPTIRSTDDGFAAEAFSSKKSSGRMLYTGRKKAGGVKMTSLFDMCMNVLGNHIDDLEEVGGIPATVLMPVLKKCNPEQLYRLEEFNPHFLEDTETLWQDYCEKDFRGQRPDEDSMESWRELYDRKFRDREEKMKRLAANIWEKQQSSTAALRTTKLAYVDHSSAKPPRNVLRAQKKFGTAAATAKSPSKKSSSSSSSSCGVGGGAENSAAAAALKEERARLRMASVAAITADSVDDGPLVGLGGRQIHRRDDMKKVKIVAPMMQKSLKMMKNRFNTALPFHKR